MFEDFLYLLRKNGLKVSLTEWMALVEAMDKGLHSSSFTGFYHLCRCLLVKSEADFDTFDRCFLEYFKDVPFQQEVSQELLDWLNRPEVLSDYANWDEEQALKNLGFSEEEIERMLKERMEEQTEEHNGGRYWVGTHGMSTFGNSGLSPKGIRVGGQSMYRRAFRVAGERKFRDFRRDNTLDTRQFQVALRKLRQFSGLVDLPPHGVRRGQHHQRHRRQWRRAEGAIQAAQGKHGEGASFDGLRGVYGLLQSALFSSVSGGVQVGPFQGSEGVLFSQLRLFSTVSGPHAHEPKLSADRLGAVQYPQRL